MTRSGSCMPLFYLVCRRKREREHERKRERIGIEFYQLENWAEHGEAKNKRIKSGREEQ